MFVAVSGAMGLAISEAALRLQEPFLHLMERKYNYGALIVSNPVWDHGLRPSMTLASAWMDPVRYPRPITYSTNSDGCRYPVDLRVPKPHGVRRILVLGDSFTLGYYYEDTVAAQLEGRLNARVAGEHFEVVNCASPSHSPLLYYLRLKHQLIDLQPDELLLNIDPTDVFDDYWRYRPRCVFALGGEPLAVRGSVSSSRRALEWALGKLYVARVLWSVRSTAGARAGPQSSGRGAPTDPNIFAYYSTLPVESEAWQKEVGFCLENISRILDFCRQHGVVVTVTMVPHKEQLRAGADGKIWNREFDRRVEKLCRDAGVDFYSPADGLARELNAGQPLYLERDMHFTVEGERLWSGLLADFFIAQEGQRLERSHLAPLAATAP